MPDTNLCLIVNADDFGISEKVNEGILHTHLKGIVTSTSLIPNGAAFEHAISLLPTAPSLDLGIHLTLVEEKPILDPDLIPTLTDRTGRLPPTSRAFARKYFTGRLRLSEVKRELEAQIEKVLSHDVSVSHLDGHQHLHALPRILDIIIALAKKYNIPAIRVPKESLRLYILKEKNKMRVLHQLVLNLFCHVTAKRDFLRPDHFAGFFFGGKLDKTNLLKLLQNLPRTGTCELMCHPGFEDSEGRYAHWGYHWLDEATALTDGDIREYIRGQRIRLISFREIAKEGGFMLKQRA